MKRNSALVLAILVGIAAGCGADDSAKAGSPSSSSSTPTNNPPATPPPQTLDRLIEEGDIVWLEQSLLYILNKTRGISIVALKDPTEPVLLGQVALGGATPIELYLRNGFVAALTSDPSGSTGSRLWMVDVRTPERPQVTGQVALDGPVSTSRLVGDILYTAADQGRVIQSVSLADTAAPRRVDRLTLPMGNKGSHVHATTSTFYVASASYGSGAGMGECASSSDSDGCTTVMAIDISSPTGQLRLGASYAMAGLLYDRWGIDAYDGVLRVLVGRSGWWTSQGAMNATLRTFRAESADQLSPMAWLPIQADRSEKVMAVRFDGPRAYVVTFRQTDPLFTIDISDPTKPFVAGHLQSPGWLDFIIPHGTRLLGVGRDRDSSSSAWRLQASLYDVSTLAQPRLIARTLFGGSYTSLPDQADNYAKVVRVVDALGIMLVPYNDTAAGYSSSGRLEVLSFGANRLASLGRVNSTEPIVRAIPLPPSHVATVTESAVGVIQIDPYVDVSGVVNLSQAVKQPDAGTADTLLADSRPVDKPSGDLPGSPDAGVARDGAADRVDSQDGTTDGFSSTDQGSSFDGGLHE